MRIFSKFIRLFSLKDYEVFAKQLGFKSLSEVQDHTFEIFRIPPDASYSATHLPNGEWAIWSDEGQPPYLFLKFDTWHETIQYLRELFKKSGYPEGCWEPEGFNPEDDVFQIPPDREKMLN